MATAWASTKVLAVSAILFLVFRYVGNFMPTQSLVLSIVVGLLGYALYLDIRAHLRRNGAFSPFLVSVSANWYDLFRDHEIVQSDLETFWDDVDLAWRDLKAKTGQDPSTEYRVLRNGMVFTVLKPGPLESLIYWNNRRMFRSEMDFEERVEEIKIGPPRSRTGLGWSPDVYFRWGRGGYNLGLEVNADWWQKICAADGTGRLAKIKTDLQHLTGRTRLVIATLPYSEFRVYTKGNAPMSWYDSATLDRQQRRTDAELAKAGWKRDEKDVEFHLLGAPDRIEHKYFAIEHRAI